MNGWGLWPQDDNRAQFRVRAYTDLGSTVAGRLVIEWEASVGAFRVVGASLRDDSRPEPDAMAAVFQVTRDTVVTRGRDA